MKFGIANKKTVVLDNEANTTSSRYQLKAYTIFRKFATRQDARIYKQSLKSPIDYTIVDLSSGIAVR